MNIIQQGKEYCDDCKFTLSILEKNKLKSILTNIVDNAWQDNLKCKDMRILVSLLNDPHSFMLPRLIYPQDTLTRIQELLTD